MRKTIKFWGPSRENGYLSNFYRAPIKLDNCLWDTSEHYYQAQKFLDERIKKMVCNQTTPKAAAKTGRRRDLPVRPDWEKVKEDYMLEALRAKFSQHYNLREKLLSTGDAFIVEDSPIDYYWGIGKDGRGLNRLGHLLIQVRKELSDEIDIWG